MIYGLYFGQKYIKFGKIQDTYIIIICNNLDIIIHTKKCNSCKIVNVIQGKCIQIYCVKNKILYNNKNR